MSAVAAAPSGRAVLGELAAIVERFPDGDCPPAAVAQLLDEVARVVRRARAQIRRAAARPRGAAPAVELEGKPAQPQRPPPASPAATNPRRNPASIDPPVTALPRAAPADQISPRLSGNKPVATAAAIEAPLASPPLTVPPRAARRWLVPTPRGWFIGVAVLLVTLAVLLGLAAGAAVDAVVALGIVTAAATWTAAHRCGTARARFARRARPLT
jgi:hypothetical protein